MSTIEPTSEQTAKSRRGLLIWLITSQLLAVASLLIWLVIAGVSFMAFDSGESPQAWALVITVWSYPILPIALTIGAWIAYARRKNKLSAILSGLTFTPPVLFYIALWIFSLIGFMGAGLQSHSY
jgi:uncharacterized BrkB/YihY/UPF0761 family membrane protein